MSIPIVSGTVTRRSTPQRGTPNWLKALYAVLATLIAIVVAAGIFGPADRDGDKLSPCKSEDQVSACYWDADTQGNGHGRDFVNR